MAAAELRFALRVLIPLRNSKDYMRGSIRALIHDDIAALRALEAQQ